MSDERRTIEATIPGESWWIIAVVEHLLPKDYVISIDNEWTAIQELAGVPWDDDSYDLTLWVVTVHGDAASATIRITAPTEQMDDWDEFIDRVRKITRAAERHRRWAIGTIFERILDRYYAERSIGGSPNLREMARAAGVKIGSLRQAKIRYDQKRREQNVSDEADTL